MKENVLRRSYFICCRRCRCRRRCIRSPPELGYFPHTMDTGMRPYDAKPHQRVFWFNAQWLTELSYFQFHSPGFSVKAIAATLCEISDHDLSLSTMEAHLGETLHRCASFLCFFPAVCLLPRGPQKTAGTSGALPLRHSVHRRRGVKGK